MRWRLSLLTSVTVFACALLGPANAASPDAVYSNLGTFRNESYAAGGATQQVLNTITRLAADDLNLVGTPPYSINGFRFTVTNLNAVDVSARPLVRFYLPDGPGGGPGTLIAAFTYNPIVFTAGAWAPSRRAPRSFLQSSSIWAGIAFDNNGGTTGATAAQLDNLALGIFSPPDVGTSADRYFVTTAAGSFASDNPVGTISNFGGAPPADFGWEILTAQDVDLSITKTDGVDDGLPRRQRDLHHHREQRGPEHGVRCARRRHLPRVAHLHLDLRGRRGGTCAASGAGNINDTVNLPAGGSVTYTASCDHLRGGHRHAGQHRDHLRAGHRGRPDAANNRATDTDTLGARRTSRSPRPTA